MNRHLAAYSVIELIAAMAITMIISLMVFHMYLNVTGGLQKAQREISALSALRTVRATLETHLRQMTVKSGYIPVAPNDPSRPSFKPLHQGLFRIRWPGEESHLDGYANGRYQDGRCRYLGFYTTRDGTHVDRIEIWFNPPESPNVWNNLADDDGDDDPSDATNPMHLMRDDRGRLMIRCVRDALLSIDQYGDKDTVETPTVPAYRAPRLTGAAGSEFDRGEVLVDGVHDVYFEFLYSKSPSRGELTYEVAQCWPCTSDPVRTDTDATGMQWPRNSEDGRQPRGLSFIALPLAVRVTFEFEAGATTRKYSQTILLPQSQWHEFTRRKD
ncbi:MAG TPA: hypothetical protein VEJ63_05245 [Planctomycetota bacterium]|nr:hypothetical protein [Planctomycetota bacterium]